MGKHGSALIHLGAAIHTLQDNTSPAHKGFQEWGGTSHPLDAKGHIDKENYDPGPGSQLDRVTAQAYQYFTQQLSMPQNFWFS